MNRIKATLVGSALALVLGVGGLAGCTNVNGTETAFTVNGEALSVGTANFWLRYQQAQTYAMMASYGFGLDTMWESPYTGASSDNRSYGEALKDNLTEDLEKYMLLRQHATEYEVTIPEDIQSSIDSSAKATMESNAEAFKKMGVTEANVKELFELFSYYRLMYDPMVEDTDREVSDEEAAQTTITYARIARTKTDDNGNSVEPTAEDDAAWRADLQSVLDAAKESEDVATVDLSAIIEEQESSAFAMTYSYGSDDASMPDEVKDAVAELADGELHDGIIETDDFFYIVRLDAAFDQEATDEEKESIISTRESENFNEKLQSWLDDAEISVTQAWEDIKLVDSEVYNLATSTEGETEG